MKAITIESTINADAQKVWKMWTEPQHIEKWNQASPDWECPHAENDVRVGGRFLSTMAAKDGSAQFDFTSTGFKLRGTAANVNQNGGTYIFVAFADVPAKYSLSR